MWGRLKGEGRNKNKSVTEQRGQLSEGWGGLLEDLLRLVWALNLRPNGSETISKGIRGFWGTMG